MMTFTTTYYRDRDITFNLFGMNEYTVHYCGDDVVFKTEDEARAFIDEISEEVTAEQAIADTLEYFETGKEAEWMGKTMTPNEREHGAVVERRCEAYYDVVVYEDGYEDRYYIGD